MFTASLHDRLSRHEFVCEISSYEDVMSGLKSAELDGRSDEVLQPVVDVELSALHQLDEAHERLCGLTERNDVGYVELREDGTGAYRVNKSTIGGVFFGCHHDLTSLNRLLSLRDTTAREKMKMIMGVKQEMKENILESFDVELLVEEG